ncbi:hypothetical protein A6E15_03830 [Natrinema saccharevitans]|uniref:Uncharacterized protein n=1 Tax=Natrinema saccharevitans TaxID=301967 RepID=A0A1S8AUD5_9EURY|nr:hypothetical protein [Natrinema saccharevitans]OLZ40161.1 hypothetical protein A6E15_03830 [Natrinema saccharevitans]
MWNPFGRPDRRFAGVVLLVALVGLSLGAGATADPLESEYPTAGEVTQNRGAYVGERVVLSGRAADADPVVVATRPGGGRFRVVDASDRLHNGDGPLERGDRVTASGRLVDESTLAAERTTVGDPIGTAYMLVVSLLGGLWTAGRFATDWRFDRDRLAVVRRTGPRSLEDADRGDGSDRDA